MRGVLLIAIFLTVTVWFSQYALIAIAMFYLVSGVMARLAYSWSRRRGGSAERETLSCGKMMKRRDGGTGRRSGLKIRRGQGRGGSTPPPGTTHNHSLDLVGDLFR